MQPVAYFSAGELKIKTARLEKEFRQVVKSIFKRGQKDTDALVHQMHHAAFSSFNCLDCANCCKSLGPRLTQQDIERLSRHLKIKPSAFLNSYVATDDDGDFVFRGQPCPFLRDDNHCQVYSQRPRACREYPHTDRPRFHQIAALSLKNCETCPVVFSIFLELRNSMGYRG